MLSENKLMKFNADLIKREPKDIKIEVKPMKDSQK